MAARQRGSCLRNFPNDILDATEWLEAAPYHVVVLQDLLVSPLPFNLLDADVKLKCDKLFVPFRGSQVIDVDPRDQKPFEVVSSFCTGTSFALQGGEYQG